MEHTGETPEKHPGSTAHAWRQRLFWDWAQDIPPHLPGGFVAVLYAAGSAADASGRLRFARTGKPIPLPKLAKGARVDVKDARRYINAAIAAGVMCKVDEAKPGVAVLYSLLLSPFPDWGAAESFLRKTARVRKDRDGPRSVRSAVDPGGVPPQVDDSNPGGQAPYVWDPEPPEDDTEPRGAGPLPTWGGCPPTTQGGRPPTYQDYSMGSPMTVPDVVTQAEVPSALPVATKEDLTGEEEWGCGTKRCVRCHGRMRNQAGRDLCAACRREDLPGG